MNNIGRIEQSARKPDRPSHPPCIATTPGSSQLESRCDQASHPHCRIVTLNCLVSPDFRIGSISGGGGEPGLRSGLPLTADLAAAEELFGWGRQRTSGEVHQNREVNRGTADGELRFVPVNLGRSLCALLPSLSSFC